MHCIASRPSSTARWTRGSGVIPSPSLVNDLRNALEAVLRARETLLHEVSPAREAVLRELATAETSIGRILNDVNATIGTASAS